MSTTQNNGCKWCERRGLPILPLRLAYVPNGDTSLTDGLKNRDGLITSLKSGTYMLRTITTGYVYTYQKVGGEDYWRCFAATDDGLFRELVLSRPPTEKPAFTCQLSGHDLDASMIAIDNANEVEEAWVGYSPVWLTNKARKHLQNTAVLWNAVMNKLDPSSLVAGGAVPADKGFRVADEATLANAVDEYGDIRKATRLYADTTQPKALDRSATTKKLIRRAIDKSPQGLVVLALNDVVGQMADVAMSRNLRLKDQAEYQSKEATTRAFTTRQIILGIRESIQNSDEPKLWDDRYRDKLDMKRLNNDEKAYQNETKKFKKAVEEASADWLTFAQYPTLAFIWQLYDGEDSRVGQQLEADIAACYEGMGATEAEKDWLEAWLLDSVGKEDHPLWRALTAGNKDVWEFLQDEDEEVLGVFDEGVELSGNMKAWLDEHIKKANAKTLVPTPQEVTGSLSLSVMSLLPRLMKKHPQEAKLIGVRFHMLYMIRTGIVLYPYRFQVSAFELLQGTYEMVWGDPKIGVPEYLRRRHGRLLKQRMIHGGYVINGASFAADELFALDLFLPAEDFRVFEGDIIEGEVVDDVGQQKNLPQGESGAVRALPSPRDFSSIHPYKVSLADLRKASKEMVGLSGALVLWSFMSGLNALNRADTGGKYAEAGLQLTSSITAATSLVGEVMAATLKEKAVAEIKRKVFVRVGAIFAAVTGFVDATQQGLKAFQANNAGSLHTRNNYIGAASFAAGSGIAGALGVMTAAKVGFAAQGSIHVGMFGFGVAIGPIGWGVLALGALFFSLYFQFRATASEHTPLEIWLLQCVYQSPKSKEDLLPNAQAEMDAFHAAVFGLQVEYTWRNEPGRDRVHLCVKMPGFDKDSEYAYLLKVKGKKGGDLIIGYKKSHLSGDETFQPKSGERLEYTTPSTHLDIQRVGGGPFGEFVNFKQEDNLAELSSTFLVREEVFDHSSLKFEYWPDPINQPEIKITLSASEKTIKKEGFFSYVF